MLDTALDALMIAMALRFLGQRIRPLRVILGALLGAVLAKITAQMPARAALWLPGAMVMMAVSGGRQAMQRPLRSGLVLLCAAGLLGGTVQAIYGAAGSPGAAYLLGGAAAAMMAAQLAASRRRAITQMRGSVVFFMGEQAARFEAIIDSGNTLRDYLSGLPVIVLPEADAPDVLLRAATRPIFADTAGGRQMMDCFLPEQAELILGGRRRRIRAAAALSPGLRSGTPALVPSALADGEGN